MEPYIKFSVTRKWVCGFVSVNIDSEQRTEPCTTNITKIFIDVSMLGVCLIRITIRGNVTGSIQAKQFYSFDSDLDGKFGQIK